MPPEEDLSIHAGDGTVLRGRLWVPETAPQRVLLLVHGLKDHGGRYASLAGAMTSLGGAVAAFDLRGHGRSDGERAFVRRFSEYDSDLAMVRSVVERRFPSTPLALFGHSMGGTIALRQALDHPDGLSALVLSAPALRRPASTTSGQVTGAKLLSVLAPHARVLRLPAADFVRDPGALATLERDPLVDPRPIPARTAAELLRAMNAAAGRASTLRVPTLLLHGTADRVTNPEGSVAFARSAPPGRATLRPVSGAFHDLWHETETAALERDVAAWLLAPAGPTPSASA